MTIIYRIRASAFEGDDFIYEGFETKSDADAFWEELIDGEQLDDAPCDPSVISYEELYKGTWVKISVKMAKKNKKEVKRE